ncbi:MAG: ROK family protein [Candidatus Dormibacteria bacterium]
MSTGGRLYAGIDLGGTNVRVALADQAGRLLVTRHAPTEARGADGVVQMVELLGQCLSARSAHVEQVHAIGLATPGPADSRSGVLLALPNLPGWRNLRIAQMLRQRTGRPVHMENDANLGALGEWRQGAGRGRQTLIYLTVSTGIGAGLVLDGNLHLGEAGTAGEVGHLVVDPGGRRCSCGSRGCLETTSSGTAIARRARELARGGSAPALMEAAGGRPNRIDAEMVARVARAGDPSARAILADAGAFLGQALGALTNLLDPGMILIGGSVTAAWGLFMPSARRRLRECSFPYPRRALRIARPELGGRCVMAGALEWARMEGRPR